MNKISGIFLMSIAMLGSGCASIVSGTNQSVSVETRVPQGQAVLGANCKLTNNKGTWFVTSPGSVSVRRSYEDMLVSCEKEGLKPGLASVKSSTKGMAFGNILFGGVIGAGVDVASGAAYDYPPLFTVQMGDTISLDAPPPVARANEAQSQAGSGSAATIASTAPAPETRQ